MTHIKNVTGKSQCCKITLTDPVEANMIVACHCTECQVFGGGPFRNNVMLKSENISIRGEVSNYNKIGGSGAVRTQGFCGNCGTHIYAVDVGRTLYSVRAGFLDQHSSLAPVKYIFGKSAVKWLSNMSQVPWFAEGPNSKKINSNSF